MNNTFGVILKNTTDVFKKSFWKITGIYASLLVLAVIFGIVSALFFGQEIMALAAMGPENMDIISAMLPKIIVLGILATAFAFLFYMTGFWVVLIVRNTMLIGQGFVKEAFFETLKKIWKVIFLSILIFVAIIVISAFFTILLGKYGILITIPVLIFCLPFFFTAFYGILCKEGKFWGILSEAWTLAISSWLKIIGYVLLLAISITVATGIVMAVAYALSKINLAIVGNILSFICQIIISVFTTCFYTVFYLSLAGINPQEEKETEEIKTINPKEITQNN